MNPKLTVLSAGYVGQDNPHELLINQRLAHAGVVVEVIERQRPLPLVQGWWQNKTAQIYHLHWLDPFWRSPIPIKSWFKAARFMFDLALIRLFGIKIVWTVHNLYNHERQQLWLELLVMRWCAWLSHQLVVHCQTATELVSHRLRVSTGKFTVIPHASYQEYYPQRLSREASRIRLGLAASDRVFLFFGTVRPYKGVDWLIECFRQLNAPSAKLVIAGWWSDPVALQRTQSLVASDKRILIHGSQIKDEQVATYFTAADIVVLPYRHILNSGALALAQTLGKPIIAPAKGCIPARLSGSGGYLYTSDDLLPEALKQGLGWDHRQLAQMALYNKAHAQSFTPSDEADATAKVYQDLVSSNENLTN